MEVLKSARNLVRYINSIEELNLIPKENKVIYDHIGGLFVDVILQAGLNYTFVVKPRVERIISQYPEASSVTKLSEIISENGIVKVMDWSHQTKVSRFEGLVEFCIEQRIDTCSDLYRFLESESNHKLFTTLNGVGPKTLDYTMKLLGFDTIAVDRHIVGFIESAGILHLGYNSTKKTVEFAADLMDVSRSSLDASIWKFMSGLESSRRGQLSMEL